MIALGIILAASATVQTRGWSPCPSFEASGIERLVKGAERPFSIRRFGDTTLTDTTRAIEGYLAGVPRRELRTPAGVQTWLQGRLGWVLQRAQSSVPDYEAMLTAPEFELADIRRGPIALERILGQHVQIGRIETIADRACYPLRVTDRSAVSQNWWIDQATGFRMKTQETVAAEIFSEREFTAFRPSAKVDPSELVAPAGAKTIFGIVSAGVLERANSPATSKQYEEDLAAARKGTSLGEGRWILKLPPIPDFEYMLSELRENRGQLAPSEPNEAPQGVSGSFVIVSDKGSNVQVTLAAQAEQVLNQAITLNLSLADPAKIEAPIIDRERAAGASGLLQSDFLNRSTGDTVSFVQLRNASLAVAMRGVKLPPAVISKVDGLGDIAVYNLTSPFAMTIVVWRGVGGDYALASTSLREQALTEIARKATNG